MYKQNVSTNSSDGKQNKSMNLKRKSLKELFIIC